MQRCHNSPEKLQAPISSLKGRRCPCSYNTLCSAVSGSATAPNLLAGNPLQGPAIIGAVWSCCQGSWAGSGAGGARSRTQNVVALFSSCHCSQKQPKAGARCPSDNGTKAAAPSPALCPKLREIRNPLGKPCFGGCTSPSSRVHLQKREVWGT